MEVEGQINVAADVSRNVLKLSFAGRISASVMARYEAEVLRALQSVESGFALLVDLSEMDSMDLACVPFIDRNMDALREGGVALVVRIIPDPAKDIGLGILSLFHYPPHIRIVTTKTREEAEGVFHS